MDILTEEESRAVIESWHSSFTHQPVNNDDFARQTVQKVLLIREPGQAYSLTDDHDIPQINKDYEVLVQVIAIGLNPVDWKGPDYNFGLPSLPWINGRDLAGVVVKAHRNLNRLRVGDVILAPSTDYRDIRKAAFQEYVIANEHNSARIPHGVPIQHGAALGVAFVAAALGLGISLGVKFSSNHALNGPDLLHLCRDLDPSLFPKDVREECKSSIEDSARPQPGDWIAIWGASSASGLIALQLAKLAKLRTIGIVDVARHGSWLSKHDVDLLVDRADTDRAVEVIRGATQGRLRFALDTVGKGTAENLQRALATDQGVSHLVCLSGTPKEGPKGIKHHSVPIKAFHEIPQIGESLMGWLEKLLLTHKLAGPEVQIADGGLTGVNLALDSLRKGTVAGRRLVVPLQNHTPTVPTLKSH